MDYTLQYFSSIVDTQSYINGYCRPKEFIKYCQECNKYNSCWACPPFDYNPLDLLKQYQYINIIGTKVLFTQEYLKKNCDANKNIEILNSTMTAVRSIIDKKLMSLEQKTPHSLALFAGTCHLCPKEGCTRPQNISCRHPQSIRPSLEAYGFDITKTTNELLQLNLLWGKNGLLPQYLILVSGLLSDAKILPSLAEL